MEIRRVSECRVSDPASGAAAALAAALPLAFGGSILGMLGEKMLGRTRHFPKKHVQAKWGSAFGSAFGSGFGGSSWEVAF